MCSLFLRSVSPYFVLIAPMRKHHYPPTIGAQTRNFLYHSFIVRGKQRMISRQAHLLSLCVHHRRELSFIERMSEVGSASVFNIEHGVFKSELSKIERVIICER